MIEFPPRLIPLHGHGVPSGRHAVHHEFQYAICSCGSLTISRHFIPALREGRRGSQARVTSVLKPVVVRYKGRKVRLIKGIYVVAVDWNKGGSSVVDVGVCDPFTPPLAQSASISRPKKSTQVKNKHQKNLG